MLSMNAPQQQQQQQQQQQTGAARRARERKSRCTARHVTWLTSLVQAGTSHHTHTPPMDMQSRLVALAQRVEALEAMIRKLTAQSPAPECARVAPDGDKQQQHTDTEATAQGTFAPQLPFECHSSSKLPGKEKEEKYNMLHTTNTEASDQDKTALQPVLASSALAPQQPLVCPTSQILGKGNGDKQEGDPHNADLGSDAVTKKERPSRSSVAQKFPKQSSSSTGKETDCNKIVDPQDLKTNQKAHCKECGRLTNVRGHGVCRKCWDEVIGDVMPWPG